MKKISVLTIAILCISYSAKAQKGIGSGTPLPNNFPVTSCSNLMDQPGNPLSPNWIYQPYKIYTSCPQIKVGIGLTNPFYLLDVNGTARTKNLKSEKVSIGMSYNDSMNVVNSYLPSQSSYLSVISQTYDSNDLIQAGKSFFYPGGSLYVRTYFKVDKYGTIITKTSYNKPHFIASDANNNEVLKVENNGTLTVNNKVNINNASNSAPLTIKANNGNKILQLENNGLLRARRIKVDTDNWADYVFVNGYKLLPIKKLEEFIQKNGHLPNIPSAKQLEKYGVDVNQMLSLQMEKIEELTLYTIEQENKIIQLNSKVEKLEQEMAEIKKMLSNK